MLLAADTHIKRLRRSLNPLLRAATGDRDYNMVRVVRGRGYQLGLNAADDWRVEFYNE
jgi:DNA-binding response OmpR family regulator